VAHDKSADARLIAAVRRDLTGEDGQGTATAVRMIWTADHLDAARRLQATLVGPSRAIAAWRNELAFLRGGPPRTAHLDRAAAGVADRQPVAVD
jgi:hypothetical protein